MTERVAAQIEYARAFGINISRSASSADADDFFKVGEAFAAVEKQIEAERLRLRNAVDAAYFENRKRMPSREQVARHMTRTGHVINLLG